MYFTKITNSKLKGFSLAEVLISILIIAIMLALAIPVLTKKDSKSSAKINGGSRIFTFQSQSDTSSFPCYVTTLSSSGVTTVKDATGKCQIYTFTVPNGVHKINLTLVAGGGGGGGAAGGTVLKKEYDSSNSGYLKLLHSRTKKVVIDYLIASGEIYDASTITTGSISTGSNYNNSGLVSSWLQLDNGKNSGTAITGHELPNDFLNLDYEPDFLTEKDNDDSSLNIKYMESDDLETLLSGFSSDEAYSCTEWSSNSCPSSNYSKVNLSDILDYEGYGLLFESNGIYSSVYLSDGSEDNPWVSCFSTSNGTNEIATNNGANTISLSSDAIANSLCRLTDKSFRPSVAGSDTYLSGSKMGSGYVLYGGEGGSIPGFGNKGKGNRAQTVIFSCGTSDTCQVATSEKKYITDTTSKSNAYGKITAYIDNPGGVGGGGAGGTAIKINDFPVTPGETYTVSVGAGGAGGVAGTSGIITNDSNSYIEPKAGGNGAGGSSTAIYDSNGNLVLMVTGGVGGYGGKINDSAYNDFVDLVTDAAANDTIISSFTSYTPLSDLPDAARNVPAVFIGTNYDEDTIEALFDDSITSSFDDADNFDSDNIGTAKRLVNRFALADNNNSRISPYFELTTNSSNITTGQSISNSNGTDFNEQTGGFSNFNTSATALSTLSPSGTIYYNGTSAQNLYLGFYQRYVVNNELAYAGGLGGFSGLGGKAGCGGLFVGNKNGLDANGSENEAFNNTFIINTSSGYRAYNINDYYGNCTTSNSNGQTADFIAPSYIPAAGEKLGQAGGGGGGGGWSSSFGAGKGGDGQNGYVMITWRY